MRRGLKPMLDAEMDHAEASAAPGWEGALTLLGQQLNEPAWADARLRVVVADRWVRHTIVPWSDALTSPDERIAHARELMGNVFGGDMSDWTLSLSESPPGAACLASAMPTALLQSVKEMAAGARLKLASVQPQLIAAYNSWRHVLPAGETAWFVTVEAGSLAALRMCRDGIDRVHAVRIGLDWGRELKRLQTFGRLASANPSEGRVFVDLPAGLNDLRPAYSADVEWLAEPNPPLTTLHQLEHLRRKAA
jgi:hypothetical protein